jgi:hypothetical protein
MVDLLGTPTLHNTGKVYLFRVVGYERAQLEDDAPIVTVRAPHEKRLRHVRSEWLKNLRDLGVIELLAEIAEVVVLVRVP